MQNGRIKWFDPKKGYGFIYPDSGGPDIFLHVSELTRSGVASNELSEGREISFAISASRRKPGKVIATKIRVSQ